MIWYSKNKEPELNDYESIICAVQSKAGWTYYAYVYISGHFCTADSETSQLPYCDWWAYAKEIEPPPAWVDGKRIN